MLKQFAAKNYIIIKLPPWCYHCQRGARECRKGMKIEPSDSINHEGDQVRANSHGNDFRDSNTAHSIVVGGGCNDPSALSLGAFENKNRQAPIGRRLGIKIISTADGGLFHSCLLRPQKAFKRRSLVSIS
jgi:hypothetical protein